MSKDCYQSQSGHGSDYLYTLPIVQRTSVKYKSKVSEPCLGRFDKHAGAFTRYVHAPNDSQSFGGMAVNSLIEDRDGLLWLATRESGLFSFDPRLDSDWESVIRNR